MLTAFSSFAGGPFAVDTVGKSGAALKWQDNKLSWYLDKGALSASVSNATGQEWIEEQLGKWTGVTIKNANMNSVSTASFTTEFLGKLDMDVDSSNFSDYISTDSGPTAVIFDYDGNITGALMGDENKGAVVGLSAPLLSDSSGLYITKGFALFNGYVLEGDDLAQDWDTKEDLFKATILHELGHLVNLDHTQVNNSVASKCSAQGTILQRNGYCENGQYIPTLYPELLSTMQLNLSRDDKITVSWIYPASAFENDFCTIVGEIFDGNGEPLKGVNVIAARAGEGDNMARQDARSFVSGAMYPDCYGDSKFYLHGIVPGRSYQIYYEAIDEDYRGASGFEPLDDPPSDFGSETITDPSGNTTVKCDSGGDTIQMASVTIETSNPCTGTSGGGSGGTDGDAQGSSGGCSFVEQSSTRDLALALLFFVMAVIAIGTFRKVRVISKHDG